MNVLFCLITGISTAFFILAALISFLEKESRAGIIFLMLSTLSIPALILIRTNYLNQEVFLPLDVAFLVLVMLFFVPSRWTLHEIRHSYGDRFHEADAVLSRRRLEPGTGSYRKYYTEHPEFKPVDDKARSNPGLLSEESKFYDPATFSVSNANFLLTEHLHSLESAPVASKKIQTDGKKNYQFINKWMRSSGAHSIGITPLFDHHLYSHKGRGDRKGEVIIKDLPHAIAITVEMKTDMMKFAPAGPGLMESSEQYLRSGILATQLVLYIKNLGFNAKAHIDGNYEVICPLVAADAGLGVIGRMGLLMTPRLGPRVRISVVTTDFPLEYKVKKSDPSVIDFCRRCNKCARVCPVKAIPQGPQTFNKGSLRWQIDSESCYNYWTIAGTDCGKCVISCPYAHPDNSLHQFIRWGTKNNLLFRIMASKLDDVFYQRKPPTKKLPGWFIINSKK